MKTTLILVLFFGLMSCKKTDVLEEKQTGSYIIRVAAVDNDNTRSFTSFSKVNGGKVALEFETTSVENVRQYDVEISSDGGINFSKIKTIAADLFHPNKIYRDTLLVGK